jgi:Tol biopolymer transport system component
MHNKRITLSTIIFTLALMLLVVSCGDQTSNSNDDTADDSKIAIIRDYGSYSELLTMNPDGSNKRRITPVEPDSRQNIIEGKISPDGSKIVFWSNKALGLFVVGSDGNGLKQLTETKLNKLNGWSPDGAHVAFGTALGEDFWVNILTLDGDIEYQLPITGEFASWSPDSSAINYRFLPGENGRPRELWTINRDGTQNTIIAVGDSSSWSPDGRYLLFASGQGGVGNIFKRDLDSENVEQLTHEVDGRNSNYSPLWSPSGDKVVFTSHRDGNQEIYIMDPDGSGQSNLTNNPSWDNYPRWSNDGSKIFFSSDRDGKQQIFAMDPDGHGQSNISVTSGDDPSLIEHDWAKDKFGILR